MKQLLNPVKEQSTLLLSLLFIFASGVGAIQAPQLFSKIMCIVIASVGIIGSVKVYKKWKSGASDLQPAAMDWFGSFLFLLVTNTVMLSVFGKYKMRDNLNKPYCVLSGQGFNFQKWL